MLETIEGKQTNWCGLWWHPEYQGFSSGSIDLAQLRKFKGKVKLYVRKNKFFNKGENGRPNYCFCLKDSKSSIFQTLEIEEDSDKSCEDEHYYDKDGNRLYTYDEVQYAINCASEEGARGYRWGDNLVEDFL